VARWQKDLDRLTVYLGEGELAHLPVERRDLGEVEKLIGGESLRGRVGGAVTLAVGMSFILTDAFRWVGLEVSSVMKYWYHFAIMFEALFILTTIDTGTRIARFLLQEALGQVYPKFDQTDWLPGSILATLVVTAGWGILVDTGSIDTIWPMFGIANQLLAALALCLVTTLLINTGRAHYAWVTLLPMLFVTSTTLTAGSQMIPQFMRLIDNKVWSPLKGILNIGLMLFVILSVLTLLLMAAARWVAVLRGIVPVSAAPVPRGDEKG
jgi:carbon starvation protein